MYNNSTIIALAWPDTKVVCEGKWYDVPMRWIGAIKDDCYNAGHAAFLLINHTNGDVHYFDYGRYHTPLKYGRVRDKETDPDVITKHQAIVKDGVVINLEEILIERQSNKACHGDGRLTASIVNNIDFDKAYSKVKEIQNRGAVPYGPFELRGSTCSRLVVQVVYASTKDWLTKLLIRVPYTISATPRSNTKVLNDCSFYYEVMDGKIEKKKSKFYAFKSFFASKYSGVRMPQNKLVSKSA